MFHVYKICILLFLGGVFYKGQLVKFIIEMFRFSVSLQFFCLLILNFKIEIHTEIQTIFKAEAKEHTFENCTDFSLNRGPTTHCVSLH